MASRNGSVSWRRKSRNIATHIHLFVDGELESVSGVVSASIKTDRAGQLQLGSFGETGFEGWIDEFYLHRGAIAEPVVDLDEEISFSLENTSVNFLEFCHK